MANAGSTIFNRITGQRITFRRTAQDTGGTLMAMDEYVPANGQVDTEHIHPVQEEKFTIVAGTMEFYVNGVAKRVQAGETIIVPPGTRHAFANKGEGEAVMRVEFRPALDTESFFETYFGLSQDGLLNPKNGLPNILQTAVIVRHFRQEIMFAGIPPVVQSVVFGLLSLLGRFAGYHAPRPYLKLARQMAANKG